MELLTPSTLAFVLGGLLFIGYLFLSNNNTSKPKPKPASSSSSSSSSSAAAAVDENTKPMTILYGSQSGTAQNFAIELAKEAKNYKFTPKVIDLEKYDADAQLPEEKFVVLLIATYGEGEPPDTAQEFDRWIMNSDRSDNELNGVEFAVFGLGNRQYEFFCKMGKKMDKRFEEIGAKRIVPRGEGDDDGNMEDDWKKWKSQFWPAAVKHYFGTVLASDTTSSFAPSFRLILSDGSSGEAPEVSPVEKARRSSSMVESAPFEARVLVNRELRNMNADAKKLQDTTSTIHIELDISDSGLTYRTAENLGIFAHNDYKLVARLAKRLGYDLKQEFKLKLLNAEDNNTRNMFADTTTVQEALLWKVDISSYPRKKFIEVMAQFCANAEEKTKLKHLIADGEESVKAYNQLISERVNIVDILELYPSVDMPLEVLLEVVGALQPRYFTISSSNIVNPTTIHITVTVVEERISSGKVFLGVCSNYLKGLRPGKDSIRCTLRKSTFVLPTNPSTPIVMIGPGTGVAPMRAFIQEGTKLNEQGYSPKNWSLYFGCRYNEVDFLYADEFKSALNSGVLSRLEVAFSRDSEKKVYVQYLLKSQGEYIWDIVQNQGGSVYICGGTSMGRDVREVFIGIFAAFGKISNESATAKLRDLQNSGRFVQELWG